MAIRLSDKEVAILLGATLMHWGVPFRRAAKRELTEHQQALADEASDNLIGLRETSKSGDAQAYMELVLSDQEAGLLIEIVEDCLNECGNDPTELLLQLKTSEQGDVETLLARLRAFLGSRLAKQLNRKSG